jgi:hypothetical protein
MICMSMIEAWRRRATANLIKIDVWVRRDEADH